MSSLSAVRPSVVGAAHRRVGPDLQDEPARTIRMPGRPARFESYLRAVTVGSGALIAVFLVAAQILGTG